ncbi:MAG: T9SS type A sorting domain-containing protein [Saprospiraceae bacterium]
MQNKILTLSIFILFSLGLAKAQNGLLWSAPQAVSTSDYGFSSPRLCLLPDDSPALVWGTFTQIWFSKMENDTFRTPVPLNTGTSLPQVFSFAGLGISSFDSTLYIVYETLGEGVQLLRSFDAGESWEEPVVVYTPSNGMTGILASIEVDQTGNPMISFLLQNNNETNSVVWLTRSFDQGSSFTQGAEASAPADGDEVCECCYQDILPLDNEQIFVGFRSNRSNLRDMWVTRSANGGALFDAATDVDAQDWMVQACPFSGPSITALPGDSILAVWMSKGTGDLRVYGSTLHQNTMEKAWEFEFPGSTGTGLYNQNHPDVVSSGDTVVVVWEESGFQGTGQDIVCAFSTTGTLGLAANTMNVNPATSQQKFPKLAYRNGVAHLIYADDLNGVSYQRATVLPSSQTQQPNAIERLHIQPNPAASRVQVTRPEGTQQLVLFNSLGQMVLQQQTQGALDLSHLSNGLYIIRALDENSHVLGQGPLQVLR